MKTQANETKRERVNQGKSYAHGTCSDFKFTSSRSEQKIINVSLINLISLLKVCLYVTFLSPFLLLNVLFLLSSE